MNVSLNLVWVDNLNLILIRRLYQCIKQPESTLVFEDLGQLGFVMASREEGLNEDHCQLVMERLAEFHATSMALSVLVS